jgi:hypothetical protein
LVRLVHGYSFEGDWLQQRSSFLGRMLWMSICSFTTDISELYRILLLNQPPNYGLSRSWRQNTPLWLLNTQGAA